MKPFTMNGYSRDTVYRPIGMINLNSHFLKAVNGGKTVCTFQKTGNFRSSACKGAEHNASV